VTEGDLRFAACCHCILRHAVRSTHCCQCLRQASHGDKMSPSHEPLAFDASSQRKHISAQHCTVRAQPLPSVPSAGRGIQCGRLSPLIHAAVELLQAAPDRC